MLYKIYNSVAAKTTEDTAEETRLTVARGIILQWSLFAPDEAANLLHLKVFYHGLQLIPFNRDADVEPATLREPIPDHFELFEPPYELVCKAWNTDDSFPHEYKVRVAIIPETYVTPRITAPGLIEKIKGFFAGGP